MKKIEAQGSVDHSFVCRPCTKCGQEFTFKWEGNPEEDPEIKICKPCRDRMNDEDFRRKLIESLDGLSSSIRSTGPASGLASIANAIRGYKG